MKSDTIKILVIQILWKKVSTKKGTMTDFQEFYVIAFLQLIMTAQDNIFITAQIVSIVFTELVYSDNRSVMETVLPLFLQLLIMISGHPA